MEKKICLVGIDGLRIDRASLSGVAPTLMGFADAGSLTTVWMTPPTDSGPGWATLLTGCNHAQTNVYDNEFVAHRLGECPDFLSQMWFRDYKTTTLAAVTWRELCDPRGRGPVIHTRPDQQRCGLHKLIINDGELIGCRTSDEEVQAMACRDIVEHGRDGNFVYFESVDEAGHKYGSDGDKYLETIGFLDECLRCLGKAVKERVDQGEDWTIAITTDHGQLPDGGHGGGSELERRSFLALYRFGRPLPKLGDSLEAVEVTPLLLELTS